MTLLNDLERVWMLTGDMADAEAAYDRLRAALSKRDCPHGKVREPHGPTCGCDCCYLSKQVAELRERVEKLEAGHAYLHERQNAQKDMHDDYEARLADLETLTEDGQADLHQTYNNRCCNLESRLAELQKRVAKVEYPCGALNPSLSDVLAQLEARLAALEGETNSAIARTVSEGEIEAATCEYGPYSGPDYRAGIRKGIEMAGGAVQ